MRRTEIQTIGRPALVVLTLSLSACALGGRSQPPVPKPVMPPQVAYRIDDHRHFEVTPDADGECIGKMIYFVDTAKSIRSEAVLWDNVMTQGKLIIDAANDQYLIGPVTRGNTSCSSGGGACGGDKMPYSTDGGRTWKRVWSPGTTYDLMVIGSTAYQSRHRVEIGSGDRSTVTRGLDLTLPKPESNDWKYSAGSSVKPRIAPVDSKVVCKSQGNGSLK